MEEAEEAELAVGGEGGGVAEEIQGRGDVVGGEVEGEGFEGEVGGGGEVVEVGSEEGLAGAGFAGEEEASRGSGEVGEEVAEGEECGGGAEDGRGWVGHVVDYFSEREIEPSKSGPAPSARRWMQALW